MAVAVLRTRIMAKPWPRPSASADKTPWKRETSCSFCHLSIHEAGVSP